MAINKVVYGTDTLIDITDTTATAEDVTSGKVFYGANGVKTTGSASYTETDPIFTASAAHSISSSDITNWNNKVDTNDYAGSANNNGGTVVLKTTYCADTNASGVLYCFNRTYSQYASMDNSAFISKGTLENVIEGKGLATADDLIIKIADFAHIDSLATVKNLFSTYSALATNEFDYEKKGLYKILLHDWTGEDTVRYHIGTLRSANYDPTSTSIIQFNILPGGVIDDNLCDEIWSLTFKLTYVGDGTSYDSDEDYMYDIYEDNTYNRIKTIDFTNMNNEDIIDTFQKFSLWGEDLDDVKYQYLKYNIYKIKVSVNSYSGNEKIGIFIGTLSSATYNSDSDSEIIFNVLAGGHESDIGIYGSGLLKLKLTYTGDGTIFDPYNDYTFTSEYTQCLTTEITSSSTDEQYPTAKSVYDFVTSQGGGGGTATTVQINGTSITSNNVANILTNSAYNASSNKIATMSDISSKQDTLVSGTNIKTVNSTSLLGSGNIAVQPTLVSGTNIKTINNTSLLGSGNISISPTTVQVNGTSITSSGTANIITEGTYNSSTNKIATKSYVDDNATLSTTIRNIVTLTQAQYTALSTKDNETLYIIVG